MMLEALRKLPSGQRLLLLTVGAALVVVLVLLAVWAASPEYAVLYARLDPQEAGAIVDRLQGDQVPYKIRDGGSTILVPRDKVYEVRLRLAGQGLPSGGGRGYEILDQGKLGWTEFIQKYQYRRALEGEIARTIQTLEEVQQARVHLVIPEPALFKEDEKPTTASVVVRLRPGARLQPGQVRGIVHLVASAVEGLSAENVTVLDTSGKLLSPGQAAGEDFVASADQMALARNVEEYLANKVQSMLEAVLGPGKAIVRITADLDWEKVERTIESYDAENPVVRSEQRTEGVQADGSRTESTVTNYEISRRIERVVDAAGTIRRLTGAVFVDGTYRESPDGKREYVPRSDEEMKKIVALTKAALGFDEERGDELRVENIAFDTSALDKEREEMEKAHRMQQILEIATRVGGLLFAILLLLVFRALLRKLTQSAPAPTPEPQAQEAAPAGEPGLQLSQNPTEQELQRLTQQSPENVARLIRAWIREG
jgi:flagellar M-ring protein FliF